MHPDPGAAFVLGLLIGALYGVVLGIRAIFGEAEWADGFFFTQFLRGGRR